YRTGVRLPQNADVIGGFTHTLLAGVRKFDNGPQNLGPGVDLNDCSEYCFDQVERMSPTDGQRVRARRCLVVKVIARRHLRPNTDVGGNNSCVEWASNASGRNQLSRTPHGRIQPTLQSDRGMK